MLTKYTFIALSLTITMTILCCKAEEKYPDKYDYVDVGALLASPRQRTLYYKCFVDEGPCVTPDAKFFKGHLFDAIITKCRKCTDKQQSNLEKFTDYYTQNEPEKYNHIVEKALDNAKKQKAASA